MKISSTTYNLGSFRAKQNEPSKDANPISTAGERSNLLKATVVAGFGVGLRALWYIFEDTNAIEWLFDKSQKVASKNSKKPPLNLGAFALAIGGFIAATAAVYTIYKTPEIMYKGKVNSFVKGKDMDVYIKSNTVEKDLYNIMNDKAKNSTSDEKQILSQQYLKLKAAKNPTPEFINK